MSARILVLEDDEAFRDLLVQALTRQGYQVAAVGHARAAIEEARHQPFDLVVADIRMEGPSGLDAIQALQSEHPRVDSIVITGYSTEADSIRAVRLGVGDYLKKPFPLAVFLASVERVLTRQREQSRHAHQEGNLRRTLLWATGILARNLDLVRPGSGLSGLGEQLEQLARQAGLPPPRAEELQLAFLWDQLQQAGSPCPDYVRACLPPAVLELGHQLAEGSGLESQLVRAVLGLEEEPEVRLAAEPAGSLLALAQALSQGGQREEARQAYEHVLEHGGPRDAVEAHLGLAWLSENPREHCSRAIEQARQLGPVTAAWIALRASLGMDDRPWNELALQLFEKTCLESGAALARLAMHRFQPGLDPNALRLLLDPANARLLPDSARWLLPLVLERAPEHARALARNAPGELIALLESGRLDTAARGQAAELLGDLHHPRAQELLQRLARDPDEGVSRRASEALGNPSPSSRPLLRLYSLGTFEVYQGESRVPDKAWKSQKIRYLLAMLAGAAGKVLGEDTLVEAFWPDDCERGRRNLYTATSYLRAMLGPEAIVRLPSGLQLNPKLACWHDLDELERALKAGQQLRASGQSVAALDALRQAAQLYRGPYLEGCYYEWAHQRRGQLEQRMLVALLALAAGRQQQDRHEEAVESALRALELDPCCQEAYRLLMRSYLDSGRPEEAARAFQTARAVLAQELGMEPSLELMELHQRALLSL